MNMPTKEREVPRPPTRAEIKQMLARFFVGSVDDSVADRLGAELQAILVDDERWGAEERALFANKRRYRGEAWNEVLFPDDRGAPHPIELAAWIAATRTGYPKARPYCPDWLVGTWQQLEPSRVRWVLSSTGSFSSDDPDLAGCDRWCVYRESQGEDPWSYSLRITGESQHWMQIAKRTTTELELEEMGGNFDHEPRRFQRVS